MYDVSSRDVQVVIKFNNVSSTFWNDSNFPGECRLNWRPLKYAGINVEIYNQLMLNWVERDG